MARDGGSWSRILALFVACWTACVPTNRMPDAAPSHVLSPHSGLRETGPVGPFGVVFAGPRGEASESSVLSIVFNRPLRRLELATPAQAVEAPAPVRLTPAVAGRWQWVGTRALLFVPERGRLPGATHYVVEVPAGTRALAGASLDKPYRFEFETPRPKLVRSTPYTGDMTLEPNARFELRFNQAVDPRELERTARLHALRADKKTLLAFRVSRPDPREPKRLTLTPAKPLPLDTAISLDIDAGFRGEEGPLPSGAPSVSRFRTYGPLAVQTVDCDRETPHRACAPESSVTVTFTNPVKLRDARRALSIRPPLKLRFDDDLDGELEVRSVGFLAPFTAGAGYTLGVDASLRDQYGQRLARPHAAPLAFDDYWPTLRIGASGDYVEPALSQPVAVSSVNVARYELLTSALDPDAVLGLGGAERASDEFEILQKLPQTSVRTVAPQARKNALDRQSVDPEKLIGKRAAPGVFAVGARYADARAREPRVTLKILQVTDLALSAKISRHGSLVWVTRLSSGAPVAAARVELAVPGRARHSYVTDADGLVRISAADFAPDFAEGSGASRAVLFARAGEDWVFRRVRDYLDPWRMKVAVDVSGQQSSYGLLFTDRGLYRPGDSLEVKSIVRLETPTGNALPRDTKLSLSLRSPDGEIVSTVPVRLSEFGTFSAKIQLPLSAELGTWALATQGLKNGEVTGYFEVAEYHPAEFKVEAASDRPSYVRGDTGTWSAHADYLFGAPMKNAEARWTLSRAVTFFSPPGADAFVTDDYAYFADLSDQALPAGELARSSGKLDARGQLELTQRLDLTGQRGPELVTLDAEVTDVNRQAFSASTSAIAHPAQFYVGLERFEDLFQSAPGKLRPRVVALSPAGQKLAGKRVRLELVRRRFTLARKQTRSDELQTVSKAVDSVTSSCEITTGAEPVACELGMDEAGYYIVRASSSDARNNRVQASQALYAVGARGAAWADKDDHSLELVTNKKQYREGESARILVKSPFPEAEALVTVERAGVYRASRVRLRGPSPTVEVPITHDLLPNAYVGVHLLRPRSAASAHPGLGQPEYRVGYAELSIDPEARRLTVDLHPSKTDLSPGEELGVDLTVKDRSGKPVAAEVTLYAVDEGVLSLIGYKTPDPVPVFTAARPLQVVSLETRAALAKIASSSLADVLGLDKGMDGGGGGSEGPARRDFRQSAYFNPAVLTDARGKASVRFKLPESLTTYRVMAVAVSAADSYGFSASDVTTSKRLMARPALPRFLRAGDALSAGVVLSAKHFGPARVHVRTRVSGLTLTGADTQSVELSRDQSVEVRFPMRAESAGTAKFRFDVASEPSDRGPVVRDAVEITRAVQVPTFFESVALYGKTDGVAAEQLGELSGIRRDAGELSVSTASTALVGLGAGVEQLLEYPYECSEQLASRLLPLLPLRDLAKDFGFGLDAKTDAVRERTLAALLKRQRGDGGFGMWPESEDSSPWISAFALWTLNEAKSRGAAVPAKVIERGREYVRRFLEQEEAPLYRPTAAFMLDVLADLSAADPGYMTRLYDERRSLPLFARAFLLHALVKSKQSGERIARLAGEIDNQLRIDGNRAFADENLGDEYAVLLDSPVRTSALVLRALLAAKPDHPLGAELARGLLSARRDGTWRSTQETAYALLALDAYRRAQEKAAPDFRALAWFSGREILSAEMRGRSTASRIERIAVSALGNGASTRIAFEKRGSGTLFYEARLRYAPRTLPSEPIERGFFVQKTLRAVTPEELARALPVLAERGATRFRGGDLVLADLVVVTPSPRDFVVIDDPIPAGFEAVDSRLSSTARWLSVPGSGEEGDAADCAGCDDETDDALAHGRAFLPSWFRSELRDDRALFFVDHMAAGMYHYRYLARATTFGRFVVPPTKAEQMYAPEVFGRTGATQVEVQ